MTDLKQQFSKKLLDHDEAKNPRALERIAIAKTRILSALDREVVAHQKTLEHKIATQGRPGQMVDPHLIGLAIMDMEELNRLRRLEHPETKTKSWFSNIGTKDDKINEKLSIVAPLYDSVSGGGFGNQTGDALEVITFKCLRDIEKSNRRFSYHGYFHLDKPKKSGRFERVEPPQNIGGFSTIKKPDFIQYGHDVGPLCIECKNYREWLYPKDKIIKELIIKSYEMDALPVIIDRRIHYTTINNFFVPAGIIAHESYYQYYPSEYEELANKVKNKRLLGFTDVVATENPDKRTIKFFEHDLPRILGKMSERWQKNKSALYDYANNRMNLAQLYTVIGSPVGGKWLGNAPNSVRVNPFMDDSIPFPDE